MGAHERLQEALDRAGLNAPAVAERLGWSRHNVTSYLSGRSAPPADKLAAILRVCRGSADEVLGLSGQVADELRRLREQLADVRHAALRGNLSAAERLDETRDRAGKPRRPR